MAPNEANGTLSPRLQIPYGKYSYELEGLAAGQRCFIKGAVEEKHLSDTIRERTRLRLLFQVSLPKGCFVLSVLLKLPGASTEQLKVLEDVVVERAAFGSGYEVVSKGKMNNDAEPISEVNGEPIKEETDMSNVDEGSEAERRKEGSTSPKGSTRLKSSKLVEIKRVADSLRIGMMDVEEDSDVSSDDDGIIVNQVLGINVIGFMRGQSPGANRMKTLLNAASEVSSKGSIGDRIELDALCGLASLATRRYHQAAELLHRAALSIAEGKHCDLFGDSKTGYEWAAQLELLVAHASFEHTPMCPQGIIALQNVTTLASYSRGATPPRTRDFHDEFFDLRTELLTMLDGLMPILVKFLGYSISMAVRMASGRMLDFIIEQLGCAVSPHITSILDLILRTYRNCRPLGSREKAAALSFPYDDMEECYNRLVDSTCRLLPLTEHSLVKKVYDETLVPLILEHFDPAEYLSLYEPDSLLCKAVAQTLRLSYVVLNILEGDADTPALFLGRILDMIIVEDGLSRTQPLLRRSAFHAWDAILASLTLRVRDRQVDDFHGYFSFQQDYIKKLVRNSKRPSFQYSKSENSEQEEGIEAFKEKELIPEDNIIMQEVFRRRETRSEVSDKRALQRVLTLIQQLCISLKPCTTKSPSSETAPILDLQETLAVAAADLLMSTVIDIAYYEAAASGHGSISSNNFFERDDLESQLGSIGGLLSDIFECYWAVLRLLPREMAEEVEKSSPVKRVILFLIHRCRQRAPPAGVWKLLRIAVVSLDNELNKSMHEKTSDLTFLSLFRATLPWLAQASSEHPFEFFEAILPLTISSMSAADLLTLFTSFANQTEELQERGSSSLGLLATLIASSVPKDPDWAVDTLKELLKPGFPHQKIVDSFPRKAQKVKSSANSSFTKRLFSTGSEHESDPYFKSFYLHVVLVSCFDKLDWLTFKIPKKGGATVFGELLDDFVEHAAFLVRVLHACSRAGSHRPYVGELLGSILGQALAMQDHLDGRVRLVGFEIFAASLDLLFLARKASVVLPQRGEESSLHVDNAITELPQHEGNSADTKKKPEEAEKSPTGVNGISTQIDRGESRDVDPDVMEEIENGGSCTFTSEVVPDAKLHYEERAWDNLCVFLMSSLGVGKYVDFVLQRAVLEYLKGSLLNSISHRSSGASQLRFEHIRDMWSSVERLNGSPWRTLNALSFYILLIIANVAIYSVLTSRGRSQSRPRQAQFNDFVRKSLFPAVDRCLHHRTREGRKSGSDLLQCYLWARNNNRGILDTSPDLTTKVVSALKTMEKDWDAGLRRVARDLLNLRSETLKRKSGQTGSFTQGMRLVKGRMAHSDDVVLHPDSFILWFPPAPGTSSHKTAALGFTRNLEAFAYSEIAGGEESENEENEFDDEAEYSDEVDLSEPEEDSAQEEEIVDGDEESVETVNETGEPGERASSESASSILDGQKDERDELLEAKPSLEDVAVGVTVGNEVKGGMQNKKALVKEHSENENVYHTTSTGSPSRLGENLERVDSSPNGSVVEKSEVPKVAKEYELEKMPRSNLVRQGSFSRLPNLDNVSFGSGEKPRLTRRRSVDSQTPDDAFRALSNVRRRLDSDVDEDLRRGGDKRFASLSATSRNSVGVHELNVSSLPKRKSLVIANKRDNERRSSSPRGPESDSRPKNRLPRGPAFIKMNAPGGPGSPSKTKVVHKEQLEAETGKKTRLPRRRSFKIRNRGSGTFSDGQTGRKKRAQSMTPSNSSVDASADLAEDDFGGTMVQEEDLNLEPIDYEEVEFEKFPVSRGSRTGAVELSVSSGNRRYSRRVTSGNVLDRIEHYNSLIDRISDKEQSRENFGKKREGHRDSRLRKVTSNYGRDSGPSSG